MKDGLIKARVKVKVSEMPGLAHYVGKLEGEPYDVMRSEALKWLVRQPEVLEFLWDRVKNLEMMVYDKGENKWKGMWKVAAVDGGGVVMGEAPGVAGGPSGTGGGVVRLDRFAKPSSETAAPGVAVDECGKLSADGS